MKSFSSLLGLCLLTANGFAQNSILLERKQAEFPVDLNTKLNEKTASAGDINPLIKYIFQAFATDHIRPSYFEEKSRIEIDVPRYDGIVDWEYFAKIRKDFFKDRKQVKALYKAVLPNFQTQFKCMSTNEQTAYMAFLQEAIDYTMDFDLEKEQAELAAATKERIGFHKKKGTLKAFLYRRIAYEEISQKDCLYWLKRLYKDLSSQLPKKNERHTAYHLIPIYGANNNFAIGQIFGDTTFTLFEKKADSWQLIKINNEAILSQRNSYYYNIKAAMGGMLAMQEDQKGENKLFFFEPEKAPLNLGTIDKSMVLSNALALEGNGLQLVDGTVYVLNEKGEIEKHLFPENKFTQAIYLFPLNSGKRQFLFRKTLYNVSDIKDPVLLYYGSSRYESWVVDKDNNLHYLWDRNKISSLNLTEAVDSLSITGNSTALIYYTTGKMEWLRLDGYKKDKIMRIPLSENLPYQNFDLSAKKIADKQVYIFTLENGSKGLINEEGKIILAANYSAFEFFTNPNNQKDYIKLFDKNWKKGLATIDGKILLQPNFNSLTLFSLSEEKASSSYFIFNMLEGGLVGLMQDNGKILFPPNYRSIKKWVSPTTPSKAFLFIENAQGKKGLLNLAGQEIIAPKYSYLSILTWGDKEELPLFLYSETANSLNIAELKKLAAKAHFGIIRSDGKIIQKPTYFAISELTTEIELGKVALFFVGKEIGEGQVKYALFSEKFQRISDYLFTAIPFEDVIVTIEPDSYEEVVQNIYGERGYIQSSYSQKLITLLQDDKQALYDFNGKQLIPAVWDSIAFTSMPNHFQVQKGDKFGIVDKLGKIIIEPKFDNVYGIAAMEAIPVYFAGTLGTDKIMRYALYNKEGKALSKAIFIVGKKQSYLFDPDTFEEILSEIDAYPGDLVDKTNKTLLLQQEEKQALYSFEGKALITASDKIERMFAYNESPYYKVTESGLTALFDQKGKQLTTFLYKEIIISANGFEAIESDTDKRVLLDYDGKVIK